MSDDSGTMLAARGAGYIDGLPAAESVLRLISAGLASTRSANDAFASGTFREPLATPIDGQAAWLRMHYRLILGTSAHRVDTSVLVLGETHIRAHFVRLATPEVAVAAEEGAANFGYPAGVAPQTGRGPLAAQVSLTPEQDGTPLGRKVAIRAIRGYDRVSLDLAEEGGPATRLAHTRMGLPTLHVDRVAPVHKLVCAVHIGQIDASRSRDLIDGVVSAEWSDDGTFAVCWRNGRCLTVAQIGPASAAAQQSDKTP